MLRPKANGTYKQAESGGKTTKTTGRTIVKTGAAIDLDPILQKAITNVTGAREASVGVVTAMVRDGYYDESDAAVEHRKKNKANKTAESARKAGGRAVKANNHLQ
jgi:hypothetical protein